MNINYEMVDLGLPSGTLWAKCNLGAETETESGLYFQWGGTKGYTIEEPKEDISYYYDKDVVNKYTKYNPFFDKKVTLDKYDDPISKYMGLSYRIPTKEEFKELLTNTTNEWVTNYNGSGVNGRLFTSNVNGKTLFFPAAGYYNNGSLNYEGYNGYVWSSSLYTSIPNISYLSWYLFLGNGTCYMHLYNRYYGLNLRAVCK